jgi:hypothetical protein
MAREGGHAGSGLAQAGIGCNFYPSFLKPVLAYTFCSRIAEAFSFHTKAGWAHQECLIRLAAILAPTYSHAQWWTWRKKSPNREIVIAL